MKRVALALALLPVGLSAAPLAPPPNAGIDWMYSVTNWTDHLVTSTAGTLSNFGMWELAIFIILGLLGIIIRWQTQMLNFHWHAHLTVGDIYIFLIKCLFCALAMNYYANPFPGTSLSLHQVPAYLSLQITRTIDASAVNDLLHQIQLVTLNLQKPSVVNILGVFVYLGVICDMGIISLALFAVDAFGFVGLGIMTLFGPIMIPFYMSRRLEQWFWGWLNELVAFAMYRAVAAGFVYIFGHVFMEFFTRCVAGDYGIGGWIAMLPVLIMLTVTFVWAMFKIPNITSRLFGGAGSIGQGFSNDLLMGVRGLIA